MARKTELAVGQERELKEARRPRHNERLPVARVKILALGQQAELYGGGDNYRFWKLATDMVLVEMVEAGDWSWGISSRQARERATTRDPSVLSYASHSRKYKYEKLPPGQYLVKPSLLGGIWGDEQEAQRAYELAVAKRRKVYEAEVERQRDQLTRYFVGAKVDPRPISWGHSGELSLNGLAALLNHATGRETIREVHWRDYEPQPEEVS